MKIKIGGVRETINSLNQFGRAVPEHLREVLRKNFRKASAETKPRIPTRTGAVRSRFSFSIKGGTEKKGDITGRIGFIRKAANQHEAVAPNVFEKGATITPTRGKFLWISIGTNIDIAGHAKQRPFIAQMFLMRSKGGNLKIGRASCREKGKSEG